MGKNKAKGKRPVRNKGRDTIGDYYMTNRKISQADREAEREAQKESGGKKPYTKREKILLVIAIILALTFIIKYTFFSDPSELFAYFKLWD